MGEMQCKGDSRHEGGADMTGDIRYGVTVERRKNVAVEKIR